MVSFSAVFATAAAAVLASTSDAFNLPVGYFYRPNSARVSGVPGNSSSLPFRRSPCPALNSLANHGYLPRSGMNISKTQVRDVVMDKFNVDLTVASTLISVLPDTFDLNLLGTHGLVEHDASLVHADAYLGADPSTIDQPLLNDVLSRATYDKPFTVETFGQLRKERLATCQTSNPNCTFGPRDVFLAFGESTLILLGFGNGTSETACVDNVKSFLKYERFPTGFQKPELISMQKLLATSAKIQAIANA